MAVTQGFFMLFGSVIVVWARGEAGALVRSEAGLIGTQRCGAAATPEFLLFHVSTLRRRLALAGRTKCVDTLYDIRRRIGCKVVRFVRL